MRSIMAPIRADDSGAVHRPEAHSRSLVGSSCAARSVLAWKVIAGPRRPALAHVATRAMARRRKRIPAMTASDTRARRSTLPRGAKRADELPAAPAAPAENLEALDGATPALRLPTIQDVWRAQDVVRPHIYHTPLLQSRTLGEMTGAHVYLKTENLQRAGSYKVRGATYKLSRLSPEE